MFRRLITCHYCGTRSQYSRGTRQFQCTACEALNFFDSNGEVAEPPSQVTNPPQRQLQARTTSQFNPVARSSSPPQQEQIFCQRCLNNQRMYVEALNSYLPDEDHPRYQEYIDELPQKKEELEKKYPQVCTKCAPKAQERIYQADYYGMSQQVAAAVHKTRARRGHSPVGSRDDWNKRFMRLLLNVVRLVVYGSLLVQASWHAYSIGVELFGITTADQDERMSFVFEPTHQECFNLSLFLHFDAACHKLLGRDVLMALATSLLLLWYNPGLRAWYHHTYRIETIYGQAESFRLQVFMLLIRSVAWYNLRNSDVVANLSTQQLIASHVSMIAFMALTQWSSERCIKTERWRIRGRMMPRPSEEDVFGETAGPADEQYTRQASPTHPSNLFARDEKPFPIAQLAAASRPTRGYSRLELPGMPPPSPPGTESASDDEYGEAMDIDIPPTRTAGMPGVPVNRTFHPKTHQPKRQQVHNASNHGTTQASGFGAMLGEVFGMQDRLRQDDERKRQEEQQRANLRFQPAAEQSPFRGRLPPAPMSVGRRLRNPPPNQVQFKQTPASKQQDFMQKMRGGFDNGQIFSARDGRVKSTSVFGLQNDGDDDDDNLSPAKSRTRGTLDLKPSSWHLPSDAQTTGLEELIGGKSFAIADDPPLSAGPTDAEVQVPAVAAFSWTLPIVAMILTAIVAALNVQAIRRPVSLWLLRKLEEMGV